MNLTEQTVQQVITMNLEEAYDFFLASMNDYPALKDYHETIRNGINITFDIHDIFDGFVKIKPKNENVRIRNKTIPLKKYRDEIEQRKALIKRVLLNEITNKDEHWKEMQNE